MYTLTHIFDIPNIYYYIYYSNMHLVVIYMAEWE